MSTAATGSSSGVSWVGSSFWLARVMLDTLIMMVLSVTCDNAVAA